MAATRDDIRDLGGHMPRVCFCPRLLLAIDLHEPEMGLAAPFPSIKLRHVQAILSAGCRLGGGIHQSKP